MSTYTCYVGPPAGVIANSLGPPCVLQVTVTYVVVNPLTNASVTQVGQVTVLVQAPALLADFLAAAKAAIKTAEGHTDMAFVLVSWATTL